MDRELCAGIVSIRDGVDWGVVDFESFRKQIIGEISVVFAKLSYSISSSGETEFDS